MTHHAEAKSPSKSLIALGKFIGLFGTLFYGACLAIIIYHKQGIPWDDIQLGLRQESYFVLFVVYATEVLLCILLLLSLIGLCAGPTCVKFAKILALVAAVGLILLAPIPVIRFLQGSELQNIDIGETSGYQAVDPRIRFGFAVFVILVFVAPPMVVALVSIVCLVIFIRLLYRIW